MRDHCATDGRATLSRKRDAEELRRLTQENFLLREENARLRDRQALLVGFILNIKEVVPYLSILADIFLERLGLDNPEGDEKAHPTTSISR
jgi:hypothetical protein